MVLTCGCKPRPACLTSRLAIALTVQAKYGVVPGGWGAVCYTFWGSLLYFFISAYQRCINQLCISGVSVFPHFRVPDTSVSDTYQEFVFLMYQYFSSVSISDVRGFHRPGSTPFVSKLPPFVSKFVLYVLSLVLYMYSTYFTLYSAHDVYSGCTSRTPRCAPKVQ
jgi:hypothetical protein